MLFVIRDWLPIKRLLSVWSLQHAHKDGSWWFCRNCDCFLRKCFACYGSHLLHCLLFVWMNKLKLWGVCCAVIFSKFGTWRDRLWVLGEQNRAAIHFADKCVHWRKGRQRAENLSLVWSNQRVSHLLCSLEHVSDCVSSSDIHNKLTTINPLKFPPQAYVVHCSFLVDDVPIRVFKNSKDLGVRFPFNQPMKIYSSLWNADDWATRGGLEKTDWSKAPFIASYKGFHVDGCEVSVNAKFCETQGKRWWDQKAFQDLDAYQYRRLRWVRQKYTIYNYCNDRARFPTPSPECKRDRDI